MNSKLKGAGFVYAFLFYAFLFAPILILVIFSFNEASSLSQWQSPSLKWYRVLWEDSSILEALCRSLEVAFGTTVLSLVLGLSIAFQEIKFFEKVTVIPIVFPDIVQGLSLLCFFIWISLPLGEFSIILAHTSFGAAYFSTLTRARLKLMNPALHDAAVDLGAGPMRVFFQVTLPWLKPALVTSALIVFTLSFDDFSIAFFTAGAGAGTLPLKIYSMLKFGITPEVNALSTVLLIVSVCLVTLSFFNQKAKSL